MVSAKPSSAESMTTVPSGALSPSGQESPRVIRAITSIAVVPFSNTAITDEQRQLALRQPSRPDPTNLFRLHIRHADHDRTCRW